MVHKVMISGTIFHVSLPMTYLQGNTMGEGSIEGISLNEMTLISNHPLKENQVVKVVVKLNNFTNLNLNGIVKWNASNVYGLKTFFPSVEDYKLLMQCIKLVSGNNNNSVKRELAC